MHVQVTPDLLAEEGYKYVMDFGAIDDQPIWMSTRSGKKLLAIPYAQVTGRLYRPFELS